MLASGSLTRRTADRCGDCGPRMPRSRHACRQVSDSELVDSGLLGAHLTVGDDARPEALQHVRILQRAGEPLPTGGIRREPRCQCSARRASSGAVPGRPPLSSVRPARGVRAPCIHFLDCPQDLPLIHHAQVVTEIAAQPPTYRHRESWRSVKVSSMSNRTALRIGQMIRAPVARTGHGCGIRKNHQHLTP